MANQLSFILPKKRRTDLQNSARQTDLQKAAFFVRLPRWLVSVCCVRFLFDGKKSSIERRPLVSFLCQKKQKQI